MDEEKILLKSVDEFLKSNSMDDLFESLEAHLIQRGDLDKYDAVGVMEYT